MKFESTIKEIDIRGYESDPDEYDVIARVQIEADMGLITSLHGRGFYDNFDLVFELLSVEYGIQKIYGTVMARHAKLALRLLSKKYHCKLIRTVEHVGRKMYLIYVSRF